jgi:hypothetical protein
MSSGQKNELQVQQGRSTDRACVQRPCDLLLPPLVYRWLPEDDTACYKTDYETATQEAVSMRLQV